MTRLYVCTKCKTGKDIDSPVGENIGRLVEWCPKCHNLTDWRLIKDFHDFGIINGRHVMKQTYVKDF